MLTVSAEEDPGHMLSASGAGAGDVRLINASVETGQPFDMRYPSHHGRTERRRDVHSRARVIADSEGRVTRLIGSTLDLTETILSLGLLRNDRQT
jgi:hypothetical protein